MRLETGYEERRARIEMVPLMDVVFLLLVFFIYAMFTMTTHRGVRVELPRADGSRATGAQLVITLRADGSLQLDGRDMARKELLLAAVERHRREELPVLISGDRRAPLGDGIELLDSLRAAGVDAVAFQVQAEKAQ
ncbi:MAG: biopolymer transporter ExbD [Kiritimatiellae bacterium]|nr:biopolymer transporter ExbD [Kiritimatiellia bacterium]